MLTEGTVKQMLEEYEKNKDNEPLMSTDFLKHPYTCAITGEEVDKPCWECDIYEQLDRNCEYRPIAKRTLDEWLEYKRKKILSDPRDDYREGYLDAIMDIQNWLKE